MSTQFDVAVIGAGPAGSAASALLRKKVIKSACWKQHFPRFVIGEACCRTVWKCWKKPVLPMPFAPGPAFS
ncbi:FAD-binding protein [Neisseria gonorrhoeae]|uniref:FAD-binding protein n=1 Tax=Neisseria gonorrhoeae TaxID=485 RepID=A0A378W0M4_NEIGO|nr:FAD-binding protein [Neisseria gonorrhoeae]